MYRERNSRGLEGEPPCGECRVELLPENEAALQIFFTVRRQCEVRWDGEKDVEIDLNHLAVWKAIEKYPRKIANQWSCFHSVCRLFYDVKKREKE
jgi:hypothetical protein